MLLHDMAEEKHVPRNPDTPLYISESIAKMQLVTLIGLPNRAFWDPAVLEIWALYLGRPQQGAWLG